MMAKWSAFRGPRNGHPLYPANFLHFPTHKACTMLAYIKDFMVWVIPRAVDCRPLSNVERMPHNLDALGWPPEELHPFAGIGLACHSDKRQMVHPRAGI